jgi:hypothetical protein
MEEIKRAIEITERMREALTAEVGRAREQRVLIRKMDSDRLFASAQARGQFNITLAQLEMSLANSLAAAAQALGLREVTIENFRTRIPAETRRLSDIFAQVRALAAALQELDTLNRLLASRALACVRGYVNALTGPPTAYDRRGASTSSTLTSAGRTA